MRLALVCSFLRLCHSAVLPRLIGIGTGATAGLTDEAYGDWPDRGSIDNNNSNAAKAAIRFMVVLIEKLSFTERTPNSKAGT